MIEIDIVTPTRKLVDGIKVNEVKIPTALGEIMILPGHTELLTLLDTGILSFSEGGRERRFAISYGYAEVRNDKIVVLAETAEESSEIDKARAKAAQKQAEEALGATLSDENFKKYQLKLRRSMVRQSV